MCFCTPSIPAPFCSNCNQAMFLRIKELTQQRDEYRDTIAQQAELLAAHKDEMQDWQRQMLSAQQQRDELIAQKFSEAPLRRQIAELRELGRFREKHYPTRSPEVYDDPSAAFHKFACETHDALKVGAGETAIDRPPLQKLGARLAELLDEDQFAECEALLLAAGVKPYNVR